MVDVTNGAELLERLRLSLEAGSKSPAPPTLPPGDGGGTSGGMEPRIARLEADMDHVKRAIDRLETGQSGLRTDVGKVQVDLATLVERSATFATRTEMSTAIDAVGQRLRNHLYIVGVAIAVVTLGTKFIT